MGRLKCQALSRPMIEPIHDVVYLSLRQRIQGRAFGHILANQPVGILVESPLPSLVGMGKIYGRVQLAIQRTTRLVIRLGEHGAVISRACLLRLYELVDNAAELLWLLKVGVVT